MVKTQLNPQKDLCSTWRRGCDCSNVSKVVCEVLCWRLLAGGCSLVGRPVEVDSDQTETFIENNQCYTTQQVANIFKISKLIK